METWKMRLHLKGLIGLGLVALGAAAAACIHSRTSRPVDAPAAVSAATPHRSRGVPLTIRQSVVDAPDRVRSDEPADDLTAGPVSAAAPAPIGPFAPAGKSIEVGGATTGVPWAGEMGITETVAEIMARAAAE